MKRLYLLPDGSFRVVSDNLDKNRFPDEVGSGEALNKVTIIGRVRHRMGEGGLWLERIGKRLIDVVVAVCNALCSVTHRMSAVR